MPSGLSHTSTLKGICSFLPLWGSNNGEFVPIATLVTTVPGCFTTSFAPRYVSCGTKADSLLTRIDHRLSYRLPQQPEIGMLSYLKHVVNISTTGQFKSHGMACEVFLHDIPKLWFVVARPGYHMRYSLSPNLRTSSFLFLSLPFAKSGNISKLAFRGHSYFGHKVRVL